MSQSVSEAIPAAWQWGIGIAVPAASGLAGLLMGSWLSNKREASQRKHLFTERQLREFYSPLLGIRSEIRALGEVRLKVTTVGDEVWRANCDRYRTDPEVLGKWSDEHIGEYTADIEYNNRQFEDKLLPAYKRMVTTFRDNLWLAEPETRGHFASLVEYVDLWERFLDGTIPADVMRKIDLRESVLYPLYNNLQQVHDRLQDKLRSGLA